MKGVKIHAHPVHKPIKIDTIGAIISVTSDWDDEGRRQIRIRLKCKKDAESFWRALRTSSSLEDLEILITRYEAETDKK